MPTLMASNETRAAWTLLQQWHRGCAPEIPPGMILAVSGSFAAGSEEKGGVFAILSTECQLQGDTVGILWWHSVREAAGEET